MWNATFWFVTITAVETKPLKSNAIIYFFPSLQYCAGASINDNYEIYGGHEDSIFVVSILILGTFQKFSDKKAASQ